MILKPKKQAVLRHKTNYPFGDILYTTKPPNTFRILYNNVNGIYKGNSWEELKKFSYKIKTMQIDVCGLAEMNLKWTPTNSQQAKSVLQKHNKQSFIVTPSNREECLSSYQPGGTATIICSKYIGRICAQIHDATTLGRWSGVKLFTNFGQPFNIITAYQPTTSDGLHSTFQQQAHHFRCKGMKNPNPRKLMLTHLEQLIQEFNNKKEETILMINANDNLFSRDSLLTAFLSKTRLASLVPNPRHHPPTHTRGSKCIDFVFGSPRILNHVQSAGISPFFEEPWPKTDHRNIFVDIDEIGLFGASTETIPPRIHRSLTSKSKKQITKFIVEIDKHNLVNKLLSELRDLEQTTQWTLGHHNDLEQIDITFTEMLLQSESKCTIPSDYPWSPTLHKASLIYQYWCTVFHGKKIKLTSTNN
jgi:hypothetical protein